MNALAPAGKRRVPYASPAELAALLRAAAPLHALVDAARAPEVLPTLRASGARYASLFAGRRGENLADVAPYLVALPPEAPALDLLLERGWGRAWGVYLSSDAPFEELRRHLRRLLVVELPDAGTVHFRFYDPRVLAPFLPTCTRREAARLFGPVRAFFVEAPAPGALLRFRRPEVALTDAARRALPTIREAQMAELARALRRAGRP